MRSASLPPLQEAFAAFGAAHPEYEATSAIDEVRAREFERLDALGHVYLDYTGSGLYAASQVRRHSELLLGGVFGNPHSANPTSLESTRLLERCRRRVLEFFGADENEYAVVFTANASQALKLVGESYPFGPGDQLLLTFDHHNSVNGIREFDRARGARTVYLPMVPPELRVDDALLESALQGATPGGHNLFAFPAQSNFSGVQHPLEWIARAQARGFDVLLDAAAFVPTNRLDLARFNPDFVALSFYKMFGYPTGVGALAGEVALGLTRGEIEHCFAASDSRMTYDDLRHCIDPHEAGAVRVSLGLVSNFTDVFAFREYAAQLLEA